MSHETHHHHHQADPRPTRTPFIASFWFVIILVGLFIAAVNFVKVMGHDDGGHGEGHGAAPHTQEATSSQTLEGETGVGVPAENTTQHHSPATEATEEQMEGHSH